MPLLLSYGFRPFFLGATIWAAFAMVIWVLMLSGILTLPTAFDPISWHAHEFLFGYLLAVFAGFVLTAIPNWTGRPPITGGSLGLLFLLWVAGRFSVAVSGYLPPLITTLIDLSMPITLAGFVIREIVASRKWGHLLVLSLLILLTAGNAVFHWEAAQGEYAAQGFGIRIGLGAGILMIAVIGGRVVPAFTRNWLAKRNATKLPVPPLQTFDKFSLLCLLIALVAWVATPNTRFAGLMLAAAGLLHLLRMFRWAGAYTRREPLIAVLHVAYFFVPIGALGLAAEILFPTLTGLGAMQHLWMGGAIGLMTLAIMTRATLGHTGQELTAKGGTVALYGAILGAVFLRVAAGIWPTVASELYIAAALCWVFGFLGYVCLYGPLLVRAPQGDGAAV